MGFSRPARQKCKKLKENLLIKGSYSFQKINYFQKNKESLTICFLREISLIITCLACRSGEPHIRGRICEFKCYYMEVFLLTSATFLNITGKFFSTYFMFFAFSLVFGLFYSTIINSTPLSAQLLFVYVVTSALFTFFASMIYLFIIFLSSPFEK